MILETPVGTQLQVTNRSTGNNFIADVSCGQLRLADSNAFIFRSEKPVQGITEITVTNVDTNIAQELDAQVGISHFHMKYQQHLISSFPTHFCRL